jgi:hypothetical protein
VRVAVAIVAASACILGALLLTLSQESERLALSNPIVNLGGHAFVPGGKTVCQRDETLNRGTRRLRFATGTDDPPAGPLEARLQVGDEVLARGRTAAPVVTGPADVRLDRRIERDLVGVELCVANLGRLPVSFGGAPYEPRASVGNTVQPGRMRVEFLLEGTRSWFEMAPVLARRFPLAKAGFMGSWTFWATGVLMLALWAAVALVLVRALRKAEA